MSNKIREIIVEPSKIEVGSTFKIKVKVDRFLTFEETKNLTVKELSKFTVEQLKGEEE